MFGNEKRNEELVGELAVMKHDYDKMKSEYDALVRQCDGLKELSRKQADEIKELAFTTKHMKEVMQIENEKAIAALQKEMQRSLIQSDLSRVEAVAKLNIYEKTDTKADANAIKEMIGKLIDTIGKQHQQPAQISVVK